MPRRLNKGEKHKDQYKYIIYHIYKYIIFKDIDLPVHKSQVHRNRALIMMANAHVTEGSNSYEKFIRLFIDKSELYSGGNKM